MLDTGIRVPGFKSCFRVNLGKLLSLSVPTSSTGL